MKLPLQKSKGPWKKGKQHSKWEKLDSPLLSFGDWANQIESMKWTDVVEYFHSKGAEYPGAFRIPDWDIVGQRSKLVRDDTEENYLKVKDVYDNR